MSNVPKLAQRKNPALSFLSIGDTEGRKVVKKQKEKR